MSLDLLVVNPVYVENLGMFLRQAQLSGAWKTFIQDKFKLLDSENRQRLINWSWRAAYNNPPIAIDESVDFLHKNPNGYRKVATVVREKATEIFDFTYGTNDLLVFGDERDGLHEDIVKECDEMVYIPQIQPPNVKKKIQCMTLVSAQTIFLYEYMRQVRQRVLLGS